MSNLLCLQRSGSLLNNCLNVCVLGDREVITGDQLVQVGSVVKVRIRVSLQKTNTSLCN